MKLPEFKKPSKETMCTIMQVAYHLMFAGSMVGGGQYYIHKLEAMEKVAVEQVDRVENIAKEIKTTVADAEGVVKKTAAEAQVSLEKAKILEDNAIKSLDGVKKELDSVKNACGKTKFPF